MESKKLFLLLAFFILISFISAECLENQININTASAEDLDKIIWVGSVTAQNIINSRSFDSLGDLIKVSGIGEIKLQDIKEQGLACVEKEEQENKTLKEKKEEENESNSKEIIYVKSNSNIKSIEDKSPSTININPINPKNINTEGDNSKIINSEYALFGFILFSLLIILLSIIKVRRKDKNEFD